MARKKRIWYPGAIYHVVNRGNRRTAIFINELDYIRFLKIIRDVSEKHPFRLHAICLMTNHIHMLIGTKETELRWIMQKILSLYAEDFNRRYGLDGHLFQGRYKSFLIEDQRYFMEVSRYIHLNPVKAFMVKEPAQYKYSSYRILTMDEPDHEKQKVDGLLAELVDTSRTLSFFWNNSKEQYRKFVESKNSHEEEEKQIQKDMGEDDMWLPLNVA